MSAFTEGCIICGSPIIYLDTERALSCRICGGVFSANASCCDGHYVCDTCHVNPGFGVITEYAGKSVGINPIDMASELMRNPHINMHGPEHHYLVAAVLLAAFRNAGGTVDFEAALKTIAERAKSVPGGICGMWGTCGAAVSTGIFISVITRATPLSQQEWSLANMMTSRSLAAISANGGPRCCKRNTYLAIMQAAAFVKERFNAEMRIPACIMCVFSNRNAQCRHDDCLFYKANCPDNYSE